MMESIAVTRNICLGTVFAVFLTVPQAVGHNLARQGEPATPTYIRNFTMPGATPKVSDAYLCTAVALGKYVEEWVVEFEPLASASRAHHMLLFGCSDVDQKRIEDGYWDCGHHGVCNGGRIMYAWAKNAPATKLPDDVGFRIGGQTGIRYLTLQIHYANPLPDHIKDHSGLQMKITEQKQKYKAGIYLLAAGRVDIPPHTEKTHADMNCIIGQSGEPEDIYLFAYRVHAHALGSVISGYLFDPVTEEYTEIAKGNPQWPQAFYPMSQIYHVKTNEVLHARCTWNSTTRSRHTRIGGTAADEMCNLYLMYYTDRDKGSESGGCAGEYSPLITHKLPADSDVTLPPNTLLEEHAHGQNKHKEKAFLYNTVADESIELEKKAHSRKNPQQGYDYKYLDSGVGGILQHPRQSGRGWHSYDADGGEYRDSRYQTKSAAFDEYEDTGDFLSSQGFQSHHMLEDPHQPVLNETSRKGKQLQSSAYRVVPRWEQKEVDYGQVVAVALDSHGDVVVFHRGERLWNSSTFIGNNLRDKTNAISQPTLIHLDKDTGLILHKWGENYFFMPHGLTLDKNDNIWVTDVGLHQVLKFPSGYGQGQPLLKLGTRFVPGKDESHFCKPTGVAVLTSGEFFVSDGYCNSRIIKYSAEGKLLFQYGKQSHETYGNFRPNRPAPGTFNIPHALTLAEDHGEVCVADRENGRVQCFTIAELKFTRQFHNHEWGSRLFSVSYTPAFGGKMFAVNGPVVWSPQKVLVFEIDFTSGQLLSEFSPNNQGLSNPHDVVVSADGLEVYVAEIGPNNLWKFELESASRKHNKSQSVLETSKVKKVEIKPAIHSEGTAKAAKASMSFSNKWSSAGVSAVVLGLLAVPIVVLTALTLIIRAQRSGHFKVRNLRNGSLSASIRGLSGKHENGLNLSSFLNKHHGFEKIATEDLDHDAPDSGDSDIEEFSQVAARA